MRSLSRRTSFLALGVAGLCLALLSAVAASAAPIWDGGSPVDSSLGTAANWVDDTLPAATDDVVFTGSVRTSPSVPAFGITYQSVRFDAGASAFTLVGSDSDSLTLTGMASVIVHEAPNVTQTFNAPVILAGFDGTNDTTIRATAGDLVFNSSVTLANNKTTRFFGTGSTVTINGNLISLPESASINIGTGIAGDDFANVATVVLAADNRATFTKRMGVNGNCVLRLTATGAAGFNDNASTTLLLIRGGTTETATLELTGGITIDKYIQCYTRSEAVKEAAHIRSTGNNTLQGRIFSGLAETYVNIDSDSGTLTIESNIEQVQSGTRLMRFRGAGNTQIIGTFAGADAAKAWKIAKLGSGTLTYEGAGINCAGDTAVLGGMLVAVPSDLGEKPTIASPSILVGAGATLDVSALDGGMGGPDLTVSDTQTLRGSGTVVGDIATSSGTRVAPGTTVDDAITTYTAGAGTLSVMGNLDLSSGADMFWNLAALSETNPGTDFDVLAVSGALTLGGSSQLTLDFSVLDETLRPDYATPDAFWGSDRSWKIVEVDDAIGSLTGDFATLVNGSFDGVGTFATRVDGKDVFLDFDSVYNPLPRIPGDTDGNRIVNGLDAQKLAENWGANVGAGGFASGDFNGDQVVNAADASILAANWGDHTGTEGAVGVPEPGATALLLLLAVAALSRRIGR